MKDERNINILASRIIRAEEAIQRNDNVEKNQEEIRNIISNLSFPEVLQLNDYVSNYFNIKRRK